MKLLIGLILLTAQLCVICECAKVVCYWASWYAEIEAIDPTLCTHIHYSFAILDEETWSPKDMSGKARVGTYQLLQELKQKNPELKIILAIGGWTDSQGGKYSHLVNNESNRRKFVESTVQVDAL